MKNNKNIKKNKPLEKVSCVWGMLCTMSSDDKERNNISLFNIIDQVNLPKEYFIEQEKQQKSVMVVYKHELVLSFRKLLGTLLSNEEVLFEIKIKNVDPKGKIIEELFHQVVFPKNFRRLRFRIPRHGIIATIPGDYVFQIETRLPSEKEFKKVLEIPLEVTEKVS